jgi:hypothetical protein
MKQFTHTIRRAAGGCSHFARVTVSLDKEAVFTPSNDILREWIAAAQGGVQRALDELGSEAHVVVVEIQGTHADTREDTVFAASAIATFRLLGEVKHCEHFENSRWIVAATESSSFTSSVPTDTEKATPIDAATAIRIARLAAKEEGLRWDGPGFAFPASFLDRLPWIGDGARWVVVSSRGKGKKIRVRVGARGEIIRINYAPR